ncbi:MAG: hypothetical protein JWM03_1895, partial [Rhodocyclales bacterium]|nr:hypothetical protein [Rhodocyclales bacterium]
MGHSNPPFVGNAIPPIGERVDLDAGDSEAAQRLVDGRHG